MRVLIRVDAAKHIGIGHVMRCLTLANLLKVNNAEVSFVCRPFAGHLGEYIIAEGHQLHLLPLATHDIKPEFDLTDTPSHATWLGEDWETDLIQTRKLLDKQIFDWMIVDHYSLDCRWESAMRKHLGKIMAIDDLADRKHDCDLLLDQNLYEEINTRYNGLTSPECVKLLGPKYALLRPEFIEAHKQLRKRDGDINRIIIFFGGSDPSNETTKTLKAINQLKDSKIFVDVIVGNSNPEKENIKRYCEAAPNINYHGLVRGMARLMLNADFAFGGAGVSTWERMAVGLPAAVIPIAENQLQVAKGASEVGAIYCMGLPEEVTVPKIVSFLENLLASPTDLSLMSNKASALVDARGCERVIQALIENC
jgi:UDP-2,4-diacetamido-2,4,6-trideoxy-beta-L-altropyranose hydrolase